jgi:hypothetical protein
VAPGSARRPRSSRIGGINIADACALQISDLAEVLAMSVTEACESFDAGQARTPAAHAILDRLADLGLGYLGLGYLSLGQPLTSSRAHPPTSSPPAPPSPASTSRPTSTPEMKEPADTMKRVLSPVSTATCSG